MAKRSGVRTRRALFFAIGAIVVAGVIVLLVALAWIVLSHRPVRMVLNRSVKDITGVDRYVLDADGSLDRAVVEIWCDRAGSPTSTSMSRWLGFLSVDLVTGECAGPIGLPEAAKDGFLLFFSSSPSACPTGQAIVVVGNPTFLERLSQLPILGGLLPKRSGVTSANRSYTYFMHTPSTDSFRRFPPTWDKSFIFPRVWIPQTFQLVVTEGAKGGREAVHLVDAQGEITTTLCPTGTYPYVSPSALFFCRGPRCRITQLEVRPWSGKSSTEVASPPDHEIAGFSPDGRYVLTLVSAQLGKRQVIIDPFPLDGAIDARIATFSPGSLIRGNPKDRATPQQEPLTVSLWDRQTDERIPFVEVPGQVHRGGPCFLNDAEFFLTKNGIITLIAHEGERLVNRLTYHDFARKTSQQIRLPALKDDETLHLVSIRPDGKACLIVVREDPDRASATETLTPSTDLDQVEEEADNRLLLVRLDPQSVKELPLTLGQWWEARSHFTLMNDGTIVAIQGDDLIRYDIATDTKRVIVKNIFETWKALGKAQEQDR